MEQRFEDEAKKAEEERQKAEEERKKVEEDWWSRHMRSLHVSIEERFNTMENSFDSMLESRFIAMHSSLLQDIASLLKRSQREFTTCQTQLDARTEQRLEDEAKKVEEERQNTEDGWSSHMHSLDISIEQKFSTMQSNLDSMLDSRFTTMRSSLLQDIVGLLKMSHSDVFASSHPRDPFNL